MPLYMTQPQCSKFKCAGRDLKGILSSDMSLNFSAASVSSSIKL